MNTKSEKPIMVSTFQRATDTEPQDHDVETILSAIRAGGKSKQLIERIRKVAWDKAGAAQLKGKLPAFTWSGRFTKRSNDALVEHSGLICADLDNLGDELPIVRAQLESSPYVWVIFLSPSGTGLKVIFRVPADVARHAGSFRAIEKHVMELTGKQIDQACKDVARLCFMSYDPDIYINDNAVGIEPLPEPEKSRAQHNEQPSSDMPLRERIASEELGPLSWTAEKGGYFCRCPGEAYHTNGTTEKHTILYLDGSPTIKCQHDSCAKIVEAFNTQLRSRIGKAEYVKPGRLRDDATKQVAGESIELTSFSSLAVAEYPAPPNEAAFYGLAGDIVRRIDPHTESDPVAILIQVLTAFGSTVNRNPHATADGSRHGTNLFAVLVGETSKARKGTSWSHVLSLFERVDASWRNNCVANGLSSGEGAIWAVRDPITKTVPKKKNGEFTGETETVIVDKGIEDKRLTVVEGEFANVLKVMAREGNTLSPVIRSAWDNGNLRSLTKNFPARATDAHISIVGHITRGELRQRLNECESSNGFANRFLWLAVRRSKRLPEGGDFVSENLNDLVKRLHEAIDFARTKARQINRSDEARELWAGVYARLSEGKPGLLGAITARAEAQVLRLSVIYALLDCKSTVEGHHLRAALALWDYCKRSARWIFETGTGNKNADRILAALKASGELGMSKTQINSDVFNRNVPQFEIDEALRFLHSLNRAIYQREHTGGRPSERWFHKARPYELNEISPLNGEGRADNSFNSCTPAPKHTQSPEPETKAESDDLDAVPTGILEL
ncbi:MAG TPA: BT4734/BF3469 family protein [Candidatus Udaeobacter sp.]|nr:BT4734/BF3469 family protein [Candidatus Udaeobacter sp.]